jgi:hypothetical protein
MTLDKRIDALIGREGGYANDPRDAGGETMWGITVAVARAFGYTGSMREMPRSTAALIYKTRYWTQPKFDIIEQVSPALAEKLFDIGVNCGQATGVRFLQRALNVLNQNAKAFADIAVDGAIGLVDARRAKEFPRGSAGVQVVAGHGVETLTDIQRAARFYYLQQSCLGGKIEGQSFGGNDGAPGLNLLRPEETLSA